MASLNQKSGTLGLRLAKHLVRRTTYNFNKTFVDQIAQMTADTAVDLICQQYTNQYRPIDPNDSVNYDFTTIVPNSANIGSISGHYRKRRITGHWWLYEALIDSTITHRMSFFLHSIYCTEYGSRNVLDLYEHLKLMQYHAMGNLKDFTYRISLDVMMCYYLDNDDNKKGSPNENYARELLELFTIGKGPQIGPGNYTNYTEHDVVEAAKVLTGFKIFDRTNRIDPVTGLYQVEANFSKHETTDKTFSLAFGNQTIVGATSAADQYRELQDLIDMIYNQLETAKYFCRRLYQFFVSDIIDSDVENHIITPLANDLKNNGYNILPVLKRLLKSVHFYDEDDTDSTDDIIGGKIKSPLDLIAEGLRFFEADMPDITPSTGVTTGQQEWFGKFCSPSGSFNIFTTAAGFTLFEPPNVAGYQAYYKDPDYSRIWFNEGTMYWRYKMWEILLNGRKVTGGAVNGGGMRIDFVDLLQNSTIFTNPSIAVFIVDDITQYVFPEAISSGRRQYFVDILTANNTVNWTLYWNNHLNGVTGAQGTQDIERLIGDLIKAIIQSPEYQTY